MPLLQVGQNLSAESRWQADALQPVLASGCIQPLVQAFCVQLHKARFPLLGELAMQVQQAAAQQGAVSLGRGGDEDNGSVLLIKKVFLHGAAASRRKAGSAQEHSLFLKGCHCCIGADQTQPHRRCYLRAGRAAVLLHETCDSDLGIHDFVRLLKKV